MTTQTGRAVTLIIPGQPPPSLNQQERMHWTVRRRVRERWAAEAWAAWHQAGKPRFERPHVTMRLYYPVKRRRDPDNAAASVKPILDGLKGRAFADDDAATITLTTEIYVDRVEPRVEIEIEEAAP